MHTLHIIAVVAEDEEDAILAAESALEPYGQGRVWDWFDVGGRWNGALGGKNTLRYSDNPELWGATIDAVFERMDRTFNDLKDRITGRHISLEDVSDTDNVFGLPISDKEAYVARNNEMNDKYADAFKRVMAMERVPRTPDALGDKSMAAWTMEQLCRIVKGDYTYDTPFLDGEEGGVWRNGVDARCKEEPEMQWLVAVDLHN
tara:strand:- start:23881 stop:24489 length:609 start_codon:yes stop_codon:yes gene_type:complete